MSCAGPKGPPGPPSSTPAPPGSLSSLGSPSPGATHDKLGPGQVLVAWEEEWEEMYEKPSYKTPLISGANSRVCTVVIYCW